MPHLMYTNQNTSDQYAWFKWNTIEYRSLIITVTCVYFKRALLAIARQSSEFVKIKIKVQRMHILVQRKVPLLCDSRHDGQSADGCTAKFARQMWPVNELSDKRTMNMQVFDIRVNGNYELGFVYAKLINLSKR